jgi:hypothetical protein
MRVKIRLIVAVAGCIHGAIGGASAQTPGDGPSVYRTWLTDTKKAHVQIMSCSGTPDGPVCGRVVRLFEPKRPDGTIGEEHEEINKCDAREGRTPRRLLGMAILYNFKPGPTNATIHGGKALNVEDCNSYSIDARASEDGKTLRIRHWTGMGRTWTLVR